MKVFARWDPAKSGSKSKSATRSKFRNGSSWHRYTYKSFPKQY